MKQICNLNETSNYIKSLAQLWIFLLHCWIPVACRHVESKRKQNAFDFMEFFLILVGFQIYDVIFSKENSFPNFAVTLSVVTRIIFRCVPLSCIFLKANKNMGSSRRRTFLFKYFWVWTLKFNLWSLHKNTNKSDGIDHHITEVGLKHVWPLRKRAEPFSLTMFSP